MEKEIRLSAEADVPRIMEIYAYARSFMAAHGNPKQWAQRNWPPEELIRQDIEAKKSYVCLADKKIVGVFFYDYGKDIEPTYAAIEGGSWRDESAYGVVHRIAGDGSVKGIGAFCINWAYGQCGHLRIDTHPDNVVMQNLLTKLGFEKRGSIHIVEDNDPRYAYEK
ncbi:MAG: N-acetyltransferase [Treponema sp.]|nr:N-acetyltransferase [Treponema sp.]